MPNSRNMNDKTSSSRNKARTSPDATSPNSQFGQSKGTGEFHPTKGSAGDLLAGSSNSERQEPVSSAPRNPGRENRKESGSTGSVRHGSSSENSTGRGSGSNSQFGGSDEGVRRESRGT
jgi:hypothetical protein